MLRLAYSTVVTFALLLSLAAPARAQDAPPPPPLSGGDEMDEPSRSESPRATPRRRTRRAAAAAGEEGPPDDSPVVRADEGNMGMYFQVGGLADLALAGEAHGVGSVVSNEIGLKFVMSPKLHIPIFFGFGLHLTDPDGDDNDSTDWNMFFGGGVEFHFRIWRRISPFFGGYASFGFLDATGDDNLIFQFGLGPQFGVEYYIGDRLSLTAAYVLLIYVNHTDGQDEFDMVTNNGRAPGTGVPAAGLLNGGRLALTFYF